MLEFGEKRLRDCLTQRRVKADQMMKINLLDHIKTMDKTQGQNNAELE